MTDSPRSSAPFPRALSLRLVLSFVPILVAAAVAIGFLFDRGRVEALKTRELEHLQLHAERAAGEMARYVQHLRRDVLFLAGTPPIEGIARALDAGGKDPVGASTVAQWQARLQQIFLSFAATRPEYFQLRLIGMHEGGRELVRIERNAQVLRATPAESLQRKGGRYYVQRAATLTLGAVSLSRIDLNRENGRITVPAQPTLRAATAVYDHKEQLFGIVVINMDMRHVFDRVTSYLDSGEHAYVFDEQGRFLLHPEAGRAFGHELGDGAAPAAAPSRWMDAVRRIPNGEGAFIADTGDRPTSAVFASVRAFEGQETGHRFVILLEKRAEDLFQGLGILQRDSLLVMTGLLLIAIALVMLISRRMTRSLSALASATEKIAAGDYRFSLPVIRGGHEVGQLAGSFRRMVDEVQEREQALTALTQDLERRVEERTQEIADQKALQDLIIENIGDGIVVTDCEGRFLLWNHKATQIVGAGPEEVLPADWSARFGVFRNPGGDPVPVDELPLVRAMRGTPSDGVELFLQHSESAEGRWVQVTGRPLYDGDGQLIGGVAAMLDVTTQKQLQARLDEHRAELARVGRRALIAEIAASAADELSQPIAALQTYAQAALRGQRDGALDPDRLVAILGKIEHLSTQSGETLDRLRALISHPVTAQPIAVNAVLSACVEGFGTRVQHEGVRLTRHYADDLPPVRGDPMELEQALAQLLTNALDAMRKTPQDRRALFLTTRRDEDDDSIVIEIEDTGPGVDEELVHRLFESWGRGGSGAVALGLTITQSIVESLSGRISYQEGTHGGALFRVELPAAKEVPA